MSATPDSETAPEKASVPDTADADTSAAEDRIAKARARRVAAADDAEVTKLPRGKGMRVTRGQLIKIALTGGLLVMLLVVQRPCSEAVSTFVTGFGDDNGSAANKMPKPGTVDPAKEQHYEVLSPDMTDAELKAAIERAKAANRQPGDDIGSSSAAANRQPGDDIGSGSAAANRQPGGDAGSGSATTKPEPAKPEPAKPDPAKPEPAKPDPAKPEPAKPEPAKP